MLAGNQFNLCMLIILTQKSCDIINIKKGKQTVKKLEGDFTGNYYSRYNTNSKFFTVLVERQKQKHFKRCMIFKNSNPLLQFILIKAAYRNTE